MGNTRPTDRLRRMSASAHLSVRMTEGKLDAHAWVTHDGRVLSDSHSVSTEFPGTFASDGHLTFGRK